MQQLIRLVCMQRMGKRSWDSLASVGGLTVEARVAKREYVSSHVLPPEVARHICKRGFCSSVTRAPAMTYYTKVQLEGRVTRGNPIGSFLRPPWSCSLEHIPR